MIHLTFPLAVMSERTQAQHWEGPMEELDMLIQVCSLSGEYAAIHAIINSLDLI